MKYIFETERLRARIFDRADAERLYAIHAEKEVKKWFPNESYADLEETREAIAFFAGRADRMELPFVLAVELKETGELIGDTGVSAVEGKEKELEIGYVVCRKHSGKGYAAELVRAMTAFAASAFSINVLYGRVMRGNDASVRVLEKSGYGFLTEETGAEDDPEGRGMLVYRKEC